MLIDSGSKGVTQVPSSATYQELWVFWRVENKIYSNLEDQFGYEKQYIMSYF